MSDIKETPAQRCTSCKHTVRCQSSALVPRRRLKRRPRPSQRGLPPAGSAAVLQHAAGASQPPSLLSCLHGSQPDHWWRTALSACSLQQASPAQDSDARLCQSFHWQGAIVMHLQPLSGTKTACQGTTALPSCCAVLLAACPVYHGARSYSAADATACTCWPSLLSPAAMQLNHCACYTLL